MAIWFNVLIGVRAMVDERIQNSRAFYPRDSDNETVEEVVTDLAVATLLGGYKKRKLHLKYLLLDLRNRQLETPNGYLHYSRSHDSYQFYATSEPYKSLNINVDSLTSVVDKLISFGMLNQYIGFYGDASFQTRIKPKDDLLPYLARIPESAVGYIRGVEQEIILRKKIYKTIKGKVAQINTYPPFEVTPQLRQFALLVRFFNSRFSQTHIDIHRPPCPDLNAFNADDIKASEININLNKKYLYRIFNDDFDSGGRFYGAWWQNLPSELRRYIMIDGSSTIEVDFKGYHIALLYSIEGIDYFAQDANADPYRVAGWSRDDVKLLLQITLNTSRKNAVAAFNNDRMENYLTPYPAADLNALITEFERMHAPIAGYFYQGWGKSLQNLDAKIAEQVMLNCMQLGERDADGVNTKFIALPIHDSFIVKFQYKDMLINAMELAVSESISELRYLEGKSLEQYTPRFKLSEHVDFGQLANDIYLYDRKAIFERNGVLPEVKYYRKSNKDNSINFFKFHTPYNQS